MTTVAVTVPSPPVRTRLISKPSGDLHIDSGNQETDIRLALTRGLAEYMSTLSRKVPGGREVAFKAVHDEWAEPEENAVYPSAAVYLTGPGTYQPRALSPAINPNQRLPPPDNRYLVIPVEYQVDAAVELWATDPEERTALIQMLETGFNPVYWRSGFVLELPHYFNIRATFIATELNIPDDAEDAIRRYRRAIFTVQCQGPLVTLFSFPDMRPAFELKAVGENVNVDPALNVVDTP